MNVAKHVLASGVVYALCQSGAANAVGDEELRELSRQIQELREQYESRINALEKRLQEAEKAAEETRSRAKQETVEAERSALDEALADVETQAPESAPVKKAAPAALWSGRMGGADVRLLDISLNLMGSAGGSTAKNSEIKQLHGGEHDPRRRGFTFQQAELFFKGAVDPYFTAETYIIASEEDVELEEAFFTTTSLPKSLQLEGGYFLTEFGLNNPTHPHSWEFIDQPVINTRLFGGEGQRAAGVRLSGLLPVPWFSELSFGAQDPTSSTMVSFQGSGHTHGDGGDDGHEEHEEHDEEEHEEEEEDHEEELHGYGDGVGGFARERSDDSELNELAYLLRWVNGWDFNSSTSARLGLSAMYGSNSTGNDGETWIYGADFKLKWIPSYNFRGWPYVSWQSEIMYRDYQVDSSNALYEADENGNLDDWGLYTQLLYGFRPRWESGIRFEYADGNDNGVKASDTDYLRDRRYRVSPMLAWRPTEYSRLRLQYNYDDTDFLDDAEHSVWLNFDLSFGAHPAHGY